MNLYANKSLWKCQECNKSGKGNVTHHKNHLTAIHSPIAESLRSSEKNISSCCQSSK